MIKFQKIFFLSFLFISFSFALVTFASNVDGTITPSPKYAFGENLGWINFGCDNCNVHVTDTGITGYAWSKQYGWINLSPSGSGVTNNCSGVLGGKAWSKALGWLDFSGASIDQTGKFTGMAGTPGTKAGRVNFGCDSCNVTTDWQQCSLRESPAQVLINSITDTTIPTIIADITITNEGSIDTEYQYEWCVVSDIVNDCGGGDDIYYSSGAKLITHGESWTTTKNATVPIAGTYYFKLVAHYGIHFSTSTKLFNAISSGGGGGGGGGGGVGDIINIFKYNIADFNRDYKVGSIDFSILLYYWKSVSPFKNISVDINKDNQVNSVDFSILLYQWGK